jgi:hypothetical protein
MSEVPTTKVELEHGRWVKVRRVSVGDIRQAKIESHERGFEDADLDAIGLLPNLIVETSEGPVTQAFVDSLTETDYGNVWLKAKGAQIPNASEPSSTGTSRKARVKVSRRNG